MTSTSPIALGPFELLEPVGEGGMGVVWRGRHCGQDLPVAVKVITRDEAREPEFQEAFRREVEAVAGLNHANIVMVFDGGEIPEHAAKASDGLLVTGSPYLVMEFLSGGRLDTQPMITDWPRLRSVLLQLLDALAHAHARGVVHRDLKLGNVLVGTDDDSRPGYKLIDFGLAEEHSTDRGSSSRLSAGTPAYEAPEQILGQWRDEGPWTDLYAFGCIGYALAAGHTPFSGDDVERVLRCHLMVPVPPLAPRFSVPEGYVGWLSRLMAKHPNDRFRCAADASYALACLDEGPVSWTGSYVTAPNGDSQLGDEPVYRDDKTTKIVPRSLGEVTRSEIPWRKDAEFSLAPSSIATPILLPPMPKDWQSVADQPDKSMKLVGAGLGLYGLRPIPLVDREQERDALWEALRKVRRQGRARLMVLSGPSGMGKTRLVDWLSQRAAEVGAANILTLQHNRDHGPSVGLVAMVSRHLSCDGLSRQDVRERVERILKGQNVDDAYEVDALTELICPARKTANPQEGERVIRFHSSSERYALIHRLVRRLAEQRPVLVWCDDVQWGHDALKFVRYVLDEQDRTPSPVLFVLTCQDEGFSEESVAKDLLNRLIDHPVTESLRVGPLDSAHHSMLVQGLLGLEGELATQVETRTGGNPLFAVQLVGDWVERGVLVVGETGFELKQGDEAILPDNIHEALKTRINRVIAQEPVEVALALELAAVLGQDVNSKEWAALCRVRGVSVRRNLIRHLFASALARPTKNGFSFIHVMLRESFLRMASEAGHLVDHHRACAQMLEERYRAGTSSVAHRRGRHLLAAGELNAAIDLLLEAAAEHNNTCEFDLTHELLDERENALLQVGAAETDVRWGHGWIIRARAYNQQGRFADARLPAERAEQLSTESGWETIRPLALDALGYIARQEGEFEHGEVLFRASLALHEKKADEIGIATSLHGLGEIARLRGEVSRARDFNARALELFEAHQHLAGIADCLRGLGIVFQKERDLAKATDYFRRALALFERVGHQVGMADSVNDLAEIARNRGDLEEAEKGYRRADELYACVGSTDRFICRVNIALLLLERGLFDEAKEILEAERVVLERLGRRGFLGCVHVALLPCSAADEDWEAWDQNQRMALKLLERSPMVERDVAWSARLGGELALKAKKRDRARAAFELALAQYEALGDDKQASAIVKLLKRCS